MRIYIIGPITGTEGFKKRFAAAEEKLTAAGHEVINPAKVCASLPDTYTHQEYMNICIPLLNSCEAAFCLKGWNNSDGANQEVAHCMENRKTIMFEQVVV